MYPWHDPWTDGCLSQGTERVRWPLALLGELNQPSRHVIHHHFRSLVLAVAPREMTGVSGTRLLVWTQSTFFAGRLNCGLSTNDRPLSQPTCWPEAQSLCSQQVTRRGNNIAGLHCTAHAGFHRPLRLLTLPVRYTCYLPSLVDCQIAPFPSSGLFKKKRSVPIHPANSMLFVECAHCIVRGSVKASIIHRRDALKALKSPHRRFLELSADEYLPWYFATALSAVQLVCHSWVGFKFQL